MEKYSNGKKRINKDLIIEVTKTKVPYKGLLAALLLGAMPAVGADLGTPTLGEDSGYTLTKVDSKGENTITKFQYDETTGKLTPVYYQVDLTKTEYGNPNGELSIQYGWEKNTDNGRLEFKENPTPPVGQIITYKYTEQGYTDIKTNTLDKGTIKDPSQGTEVEGGASLNNPAKTTISIDNVLYKDNKTFVEIIGNNAPPKYVYILGGAIHNTGEIEKLSGDFINNLIEIKESGSISSSGFGGAIYNRGVIGDINANFVGNSIINRGSTFGGAIYNKGSIDNITGDFIGNSTSSEGGAVYNYTGKIDIITGDFIGNYTQSSDSVYGGAVHNGIGIIGNTSAINNIAGNFIGNYAQSSYNSAKGGAIYNFPGIIGNIIGDFIGNYAQGSYETEGGAIYNTYGEIGNITGDFIGNYVEGSRASGGAIYNGVGSIGTITGDFIDNYSSDLGGAISNYGDIGNITGDFIGNYASYAGGAIFTKEQNYTTKKAIIQSIEGNFINNYVEEKNVQGGAIYTGSNIQTIKGNFIENKATGITSASGGAIYNSEYYNGYRTQFCGTIGTITGEYISNSAEATNGNAQGGAITNAGVIETINANFTNNYTKSVNGNALGGAIYNSGNISSYNVPIDKIVPMPLESYILKNSLTGESIKVYSVLDEDTKNQINTIISEGKKLSLVEQSYEQTVLPEEWEELKKQVDLGISEGEFSYSNPYDDYSEDVFVKILPGIINSSFINNYAKSETGEAKGGAIYTTADLGLVARDGYTSIISGNYVEDKNGKRPEAIYVDNQATLTLQAESQGSFVINDQINGSDGYSVNFEGDETGIVYLNNKIESVDYSTDMKGSANINLSNITLNLGRDNVLNNNNLALNSGTLNMINNTSGLSSLKSLTITGDTNFAADVDLANEKMDRFTAEDYGTHSGNLNVIGMNLLSDSNSDTTEIFFAETGLKDNVVNGTGELPDSNYQTAYTPIYKYNVSYDNREDGGYFVFAKGGLNSSNPSDNYNPSVLAAPSANVAANQSAINEVFKYTFEHADAFTQLPAMERYAKINANKYAISTDFNDNLPSYADQLHNQAVWFRPYTTFENINLKNGPKVDAITYGSLVGYDGDFKEMKNGWNRVFTGYVGYMGSSLNYSGVDATMNGGLIGFTESFYKGNFWTAISATAGASVTESHTMYGKEDATSLLAGVGSKTGYNFEFKDGKFIIQPIMFLSYTFVNTFDYTNAAGVKIESDPLHTIQLNPSVRFIGNLKNGWQPYASVGMVWNLLNSSEVTANNVKLPEMSVKPYVEYGVGVQRNWKDKFTAFFQTMIRNGGRNGISFTGGFRMLLGSDPSKNSDKPKVKKEIKSL